MSFWLSASSFTFPPLAQALRAPEGLLAIGGDLSAERLLAAYRHGCFPWFSEGQPILWWSPNPRMVLFPNELHVARSLKKRFAVKRLALPLMRVLSVLFRPAPHRVLTPTAHG